MFFWMSCWSAESASWAHFDVETACQWLETSLELLRARSDAVCASSYWRWGAAVNDRSRPAFTWDMRISKSVVGIEDHLSLSSRRNLILGRNVVDLDSCWARSQRGLISYVSSSAMSLEACNLDHRIVIMRKFMADDD